MSARDELARDIPQWTDLPFGGRDGFVKLDANAAHAIAGVLIELGYSKPRTITTVEELDALPEKSVIRDADGSVYEAFEAWNRDESSYGIQWLETGTSWRAEMAEIALPATVLYEPSAK
jgi:hypothetical protein